MLENQREDSIVSTAEFYHSQSPVSAGGHSTLLSRTDDARTTRRAAALSSALRTT